MTPEEWDADKHKRADALWKEKIEQHWQPFFWDCNLGTIIFAFGALLFRSHLFWLNFFVVSTFVSGLACILAAIQMERYAGRVNNILEEERPRGND